MTSPGTPTADVSVVIPTYRRADRCRAAVASALEQTRAPREVVLVVDGPHDPDYDDWEYGTEPLPHEAWIAGRGGAGAPPAGGEDPQSIAEETTPGG